MRINRMDYCVSAIGVLFCTFFFFSSSSSRNFCAKIFLFMRMWHTHTHTYMNSTKHIYSRCGQNGKCLRDAAQKLLCQQQTHTHTSHYACLSPIFFYSFHSFIIFGRQNIYIYENSHRVASREEKKTSIFVVDIVQPFNK